MKLTDITGDRRPAEARFGEEPDVQIVHFVYDPQRYTPALEAEFEEIATSQFQSRALVLFARDVIVEWDLERDVLDDKGKPTGDVEPIPLTEEGLMKVPVPVLATIINAIKTKTAPSSEEGKASAGGSQPAATSESSLAGTN